MVYLTNWGYNMKTNINCEKPVVIWIVLLLMFTFNLTTIVSSTYIYDTGDGVFFDDFEDWTHINDSKKCVLEDGVIKLEKGEHDYNHDFSDDREHQAWDVELSSIFSGNSDLMRMRNLIGQSSVDKELLEKDDGKVVRTESVAVDFLNLTSSPVHHFRFNVGQFGQYLDYFTFSWYGNYSNNANIDRVNIYIWNHSALFSLGSWEKMGNVTYDSSVNGGIDFVGSGDSYISDEGYIDFLIVAFPLEKGTVSILDTDYVNVVVKTLDCYAREGYIVSPVITKPASGRWESIVWSGSPLSSSSSLKIHVLNSTGHLISDYYLPGNSEGFNFSPFDLSILSDDFVSIKIKASFESVDLIHSSWLRSWGLTWQTDGGRFHDGFDTELRIDKAFGVKSAGGKISIDADYSDWLIYGKNPENTRSYEGYGPINVSTYRYTEGTAVGGGLRSPILSNGVVYITSSVDKKIHTFNADTLSPLAQSSELPYVVDASVAIADNLVIVATSGIKKSNKIYALSESTLTEEWSYIYGNGTDDICFSSAPLISDGKVFVTSWNGMGWDMPLASILYELQLVKGNNKIIALDLNDGTEVWNASLPASSFSTPAVADGMVFVGCDNLMGNSLFAFDQETGVKIWNTSVGLIGRSSPVVYDDKVFVVVKDQKLISLKGDVKAVAVDEYNGTMLWEKTIATNITTFESLPKAFQLYDIMSTSTPAIREATLFATSPDGKLSALETTDGEMLWTADLSSGLSASLPIYPCTSPVATTDVVYTASADGYVHAVDMSGGNLWDFRCVTNKSDLLDTNYILAAPVVADGVLYVSVIEEITNQSSRVYSIIGNITTRQRGRVVSERIRVPREKWWSKFTADVGGNGDITFSILDEHYNLLSDDVDEISNLSVVNTTVIRLCAEFSKNGSENPVLDSWSILWKKNSRPVFDMDSFLPDPDGWINNNKPVCSINVRDTMPGLNVDSARYQITYVSIENKTVTSGWNAADCSGGYGTTENQSITADISALDFSEDIAELKSLTLSIKDLADYESKVTIYFKTDMIKPTSHITDVEGFSSTYNESVAITATADDSGDPDVNKSGIGSVTLYYRRSGGDWTVYNTDSYSPYSWLFENDVSGEYEFCTVAEDNAGNVEDYPSKADLSFVLDTNKPSPPVYEELFLYRFNEIPRFSGERLISFSDDYKLKSIEYRLSFYGLYEWVPVDLDIKSKNYKEEWNLTPVDWEYMKEGENYILYFRLTDVCGNQYVTPEDKALTVVKDLTASKVYLDMSDFEEWHWDNKFTIAADVPDGGSDISEVSLYYRYAANRGEWGNWKQYGNSLTTSPFKWSLTIGGSGGYYEFKVSVVDFAGNVGESKIEPISLTIFPVIQIALVIILAFVFLIFTVKLIRKMKKKT